MKKIGNKIDNPEKKQNFFGKNNFDKLNNYKACSFYLMIIFLQGISLFAEETIEFRDYYCRQAAAPVLDGRLDDPCWRNADKITGFRLIFGKGPAREQTVGTIVYDAENIYLGISCKESNVKKLLATQTVHDSPVWKDDCLEIFFDTNCDRATYYHFVVNSLGTKFEEKGQDKSWNAEWNVKTAIGDGQWSAEVAIPFSAIGARPGPDTVWGFNLGRAQRILPEFSGWANTGASFHTPKKFGLLVFIDYLSYINKHVLPEYEQLRSETAKLVESVPEKRYKKKFTELEAPVEIIKKELLLKKNLTSGEASAIHSKIAAAAAGYKSLKNELKLFLLMRR
ncbi:MAG: carbohydrate binding family 9 domain-containing protein [Victivallaceae bacterium]|nr:carbohydrate binding family 9 domain-containing protein [Victivallaceae bacterium]